MVAPRKALLLRVGMDRGTGGVLAPIFPDGTFEYLPVPETGPTRLSQTYATLPGRHVASLASLIPARLAHRHPHLDPDFTAATYGDAASGKRRQLSRLAPGDQLVFYAGLEPSPPDDRARLCAIGRLGVAAVHRLSAADIRRPNLEERFGQTAHFLREVPDREFVLVEGHPGESRRFGRAIPLGDGHDRMLPDLAALGYRGSLLRSVGHWIRGEAALRVLDAWLEEGPASLVEQGTHLVRIAVSALGESQGDLAIDESRMRIGDWIIAVPQDGRTGIQALARINRIEDIDGNPRAMSSLYWQFTGRPSVGPTLPAFISDRIADGAMVGHLVAWFGAHYRIGAHRLSP